MSGVNLFICFNLELPIVKFVCGAKEIINYEKWSIRAHSGVILTRRMLPLKLAWAMSIHKSQVVFSCLI